MDLRIEVAGPQHYRYAEAICELIEEAARARGTGIAKRKPEYIRSKMEEGKAVIALGGDVLAGFCYIETWSHNKYVANSGLIVAPAFRQQGLAKRIKRRAFELSREKYPDAKLFGITTSLAVMKINSELGYKPVTFSELTTDDDFWQGCQSCPNYDVLSRTQRRMCLCTGMLYDPARQEKKEEDDSPIRRQLRKKLMVYRVMHERVNAYVTALNTRDVEQALGCLNDDFRLHRPQAGMTVGRAQMHDLLAWDASLGGRLDQEDLEIGDDEITGVFVRRHDLLRLLGLDALRARITFHFGPNGYISEQVYLPLPGEPTLEEALQPVRDWAVTACPDDLAPLYDGDRLVLSGETAVRWRVLLQAWREAVPAQEVHDRT